MAERISAMDFSIGITFPFLEVLCGGHFNNIGSNLCGLDLDSGADSSLSCGQVILGNLSLCLVDIEVLELLQEPALDGGVGNLLLDHVIELSLDLLGGGDADVVSHQTHVQTLVGLLLLDLLGGSDGSELEGGLNCLELHQFSILCGGGVASLLEVELGTFDGVIEQVEAEELGGGDGVVGSGLDRSIRSKHSNFPFWLIGLGGRSQPLFLVLCGFVSLTLYGHIIPKGVSNTWDTLRKFFVFFKKFFPVLIGR